MRDDRERLLDMLEAIQKIEQYAQDETFSPQNEDLVEIWMIHHLQIIGEAASRVSGELRAKHLDPSGMLREGLGGGQNSHA